MKMYFVFFVFANILLQARFLPAKEEGRIFKGREANDGEFPWMVFIKLTDDLNCSGFLLSNYYVVTAAHCMIRSATDMRGVIGSVDREQDNMLEFETHLIHPEYSSENFYADVALLKFKTPIEFTSLIKPICIGKKSSFIQKGNGVLQMGWGRDRNDSAIVSKKLKVTEVGKLMSQDYCNSFLEELNVTSIGRICVKNTEIEGVCEGDSGGPLVYKDPGDGYVVVGLVSFGFYINCTVTNEYPEIYTNVAHYSDWITENVESACVIE